MVNDLVENRALCELYPLKQNNCNEMVSAYKQADDMYALQDYIDAQFGGPGKGFLRIVKTPAEARKVINDGKLAWCSGSRCPRCSTAASSTARRSATAAQIDSELDKLYAAGVRSLFPVHKFDNALGGTKFDSGATGVLVNIGNKYATGQFWTAEPLRRRRPRQRADQQRPASTRRTIYTLFGPVLTQPLLQGQLPVYPPAPLCNPKGLTPLGEHLVRGDDAAAA